MATLLIQESYRSTLTPADLARVTALTSLIVPGVPVIYTDTEGAEWAVWDDPRVPLADVALAGAAFAHLGELTADPAPPREEVRAAVLAQCEANGWIVAVELGEDEDPYHATMVAQGPPDGVRMAVRVSEGWVPADTEP